MRWASFLLLIPILQAATPSYEPRISYIDGDTPDSQCKTKLERRIYGLSGTVYSHSEYGYAPYNATKNCIVVLIAPVGYRIRLRVLDFDVPSSSQSRCKNGDTLHVFDHESVVEQTTVTWGVDDMLSPGAIMGQFCGRINTSTILATSTQNAMTVWWHSASPGDEQPHVGGKGFRLHWNAYRETRKNVPCKTDREFACSNGDECIPAELACNKQSDCNDASDLIPRRQKENMCENMDLDPLSAISGPHLLLFALATVISVASFCVCACFMCRCLQRPGRTQTKDHQKYSTEGQGLRTLPDGCTPYPPSFLPPSPPKMQLPAAQYNQAMPNQYLPGFPKQPGAYAFSDDSLPQSSGEYALGMSSWADMELSSRYGGAMGDDEENQRKSDERERKKAEVRRRLEDANRSKKAKKGFLTPERKKKLRKLLMMKAAEDLKQQQMLKEQERQRILQERILPLPDLNSCDVDETFEEFLERVLELESDIYDLSYTVRQKDFEINELTIAVNDLRGKFVKPTLKKVSKTDSKFNKIKKIESQKVDFGSGLRKVEKNDYSVDAPKEPKEKLEWQK
ncbi:unnamed protein product, partial [Mesorhabditis spiculigera]